MPSECGLWGITISHVRHFLYQNVQKKRILWVNFGLRVPLKGIPSIRLNFKLERVRTLDWTLKTTGLKCYLLRRETRSNSVATSALSLDMSRKTVTWELGEVVGNRGQVKLIMEPKVVKTWSYQNIGNSNTAKVKYCTVRPKIREVTRAIGTMLGPPCTRNQL